MDKTDILPDKKEAIMNAALLLFTKRGFYQTPTSLISKEAKVATGTLFHYFKTKEELIDSIYAISKEEYKEALIKGFYESSTVKDKMRTLCKNSIRWAVKNPEKHMFIRLFCSSPVISGEIREDVEKRFTFIDDLFSEASESEIFTDADPRLHFRFCISSINGACDYIIENGLQDKSEAISETVFNLIWDGIAKKGIN